ncbi:Nitrilotriacetate monooxygenase component A [Andreprevotia sp. IGB-42]|uniref:LLM class flavin-dependent oxidoreductase n=1 Tax=Andreprevotia sp. IGB-42 TaxID=2497473 RepID=UPI001357B45D|nr:LLM class flavin-dependent oxidoreductase [Andreprevotia sp. IGB-42]KAF0815099.1 Nitrilotriacetate monooxygenase component A [Andreprevotia sp. IGB-42]
MPRQLVLNAFLHDTGHHEAAWRHLNSGAERINDITFYQQIAQKAEAGKLDSVFLADVPGLAYDTGHRLSHGLDPITLLSAVAAVTSRIGLIASASTTLSDPYTLARQFASLDTISNGRAGWNIVTTYAKAAARNYGLDDMPPHAERYLRAHEFVEVANKLWDSWEDDALVIDRDNGILFDTAKVHAIDHHGDFYNVRGPLTLPRSPQGRPVLVQAGASNDGREFAARHAEAVFTAHQTVEDARAFYTDLKHQAASFGRNADQVLILPGISPFVADTEQEARELAHELNTLTVPAYGLAQLQVMAGQSFADLAWDDKVPLERFGQAGNVLDNNRGRRQLVANIVERDRPTLRELLYRLAGARGHNVVAGTPVQVADIITEWFNTGAADGFNVMPPLYPALFNAFVDKVVPILQERGLFRTEYAGSTLREHYGLSRPRSQFAGR